MKTSRSLTPGGWFRFWGRPPPGSVSPFGFRRWRFLGGVILLLAGRPAGGAEAAFPPRLEDHGGGSMDEFSRAAPVFHTRDALSDAQVLQRIRNSAGLRDIFSLTRNHAPGSAGSDHPPGVLLTSAPRSFLPPVTPGQRSLAVFAADAVGRHFEKLSTWSGQSGVGLIYPLNSRVGLFVDARRVTPHGTRYYGITRVGLRVLF